MAEWSPYEERAAILEFDAGYPRHVAERMAREQLAARERIQGELFAEKGGQRARTR